MLLLVRVVLASFNNRTAKAMNGSMEPTDGSAHCVLKGSGMCTSNGVSHEYYKSIQHPHSAIYGPGQYAVIGSQNLTHVPSQNPTVFNGSYQESIGRRFYFLNVATCALFQSIQECDKFVFKLEKSIISKFCNQEKTVPNLLNDLDSQAFLNPLWRTQRLKFNCLNFVIFSHFRRLNNPSRFVDNYQSFSHYLSPEVMNKVSKIEINQSKFPLWRSILNFLNTNQSYIGDVFRNAFKLQNTQDINTLVAFTVFMKYPHREEFVSDLMIAWCDVLFTPPENCHKDLSSRLIQKTKIIFSAFDCQDVCGVSYSIHELENPNFSFAEFRISVIHNVLNDIEEMVRDAPVEFKVWHFNVCKYTYPILSILKSAYLFSIVRDDTVSNRVINTDPITHFSVDIAAVFSTFDYNLFTTFFNTLGTSHWNYIDAIRSHME